MGRKAGGAGGACVAGKAARSRHFLLAILYAPIGVGNSFGNLRAGRPDIFFWDQWLGANGVGEGLASVCFAFLFENLGIFFWP